MLTYEKVFEIFKDYLAADHEVEVLHSRRGYVRVQWDKNTRYCEDGCLCRTPEELFEVLLDDYRGYEEIKLTKGRRELTAEDSRKMDALCQPFLDKRRMEEAK